MLDEYREYFERRIAEDPEFRREIEKLSGKRIGCYCHPAKCHGDVIAAWLDGSDVEIDDDSAPF